MVQHYRCPERYADLAPAREFLMGLKGPLESYFQALPVNGGHESAASEDSATELLRRAEEAIQDLRCERYASDSDSNILRSPVASVYYFFRPILRRAVRKYIQRVYLSRWKKLTFPQWPVDTTVDELLGQ